MKVVVEKPVSWLESERDGERNRLMYNNLLQALRILRVEITETETHYGNDFAVRAASSNSILISYHSIGRASNVWRLKETPIPFFYNIDRFGYSGWSELSIEDEKFKKIVSSRDNDDAKIYCEMISKWLISKNLSKYTQNSKFEDEHHGFIFFPMQVRSDIVAVHNRIDPLTVLHEVAKVCKKENKLLLVKRHPYCTSKKVARRLFIESHLNKFVRITNASVTSLLPACDAVLVGNSGVGLEAIIYGKPVYSFARSEYDIASYQLHTQNDIKSIFSASYAPHPNGYKFGRFFLAERCFDSRSVADICEKLRNLVNLE